MYACVHMWGVMCRGRTGRAEHALLVTTQPLPAWQCMHDARGAWPGQACVSRPPRPAGPTPPRGRSKVGTGKAVAASSGVAAPTPGPHALFLGWVKGGSRPPAPFRPLPPSAPTSPTTYPTVICKQAQCMHASCSYTVMHFNSMHHSHTHLDAAPREGVQQCLGHCQARGPAADDRKVHVSLGPRGHGCGCAAGHDAPHPPWQDAC